MHLKDIRRGTSIIHCYPGCKERVQAQKVNEAFVNLFHSITFNQDAIDLFKKLAEPVFIGNQLDHSYRAKQTSNYAGDFSSSGHLPASQRVTGL